jgi:dienelactone hydrolase
MHRSEEQDVTARVLALPPWNTIHLPPHIGVSHNPRPLTETETEERTMFEYFKSNYAWSLAALTLIEEVGTISQPAEVFAAVEGMADAPAEEASRAWYDAMTAMGEKQEKYANIDLAARTPLTAARKFHRAAAYFMRANRISSHEDPGQLVSYKRAIENYRKAREYGEEGVEFVDIPFEKGFMPALLIPATTDGKPSPIVVHIQGFDSVKETFFPVLREYRRRGLSCLIVDQPGAGGALRLHGLKARIETEVYVGAIVDWIMSRRDLATNMIGLTGVSMGGFFAPRAAVFEHRIRACAAWGALYDAKSLSSGRADPVPNVVKHAIWSWDLKSLDAWIDIRKQITLIGIVEKITCPLLVMHGENDRQIPVSQAVATYEAATTADKTLKIFTKDEGGAEHCQIDNRAIAADYLADWFASRLRK